MGIITTRAYDMCLFRLMVCRLLVGLYQRIVIVFKLGKRKFYGVCTKGEKKKIYISRENRTDKAKKKDTSDNAER